MISGIGRAIVRAAPWLMRFLSVAGTAAMFLVGGGILTHGIGVVHHAIEEWSRLAEGIPAVGAVVGAVTPTLPNLAPGVVAGAVLYSFSYLGGRMSPYFAPHLLRADHAAFDQSNTIFHTDFYWLGKGLRRIRISMSPQNREHDDAFFVEFRVHRCKTNDPAVIDCSYHHAVTLPSAQEVQQEITIAIDDDYTYAVLAVLDKGSPLFSEIRVRISVPAKEGATKEIAKPELPIRRIPFLQRMMTAGSLLAPEWVKQSYRRVRPLITS